MFRGGVTTSKRFELIYVLARRESTVLTEGFEQVTQDSNGKLKAT